MPSQSDVFAGAEFDPLATVSPPSVESPARGNASLRDGPSLDVRARYFIGNEIGRGGVGVVHECWDAMLERTVALKRLWPKYAKNPEMVARFLNEARITSLLQHPGIVPIHELGVDPDGLPYFIMGLVRHGESLNQLLSKRADPSTELLRMLGILLQICETVAYAHEQSVIHRDLKPSNVIVGSFGVVKVADWGSAKVLEPLAPARAGSPASVTAAFDAARAPADDPPGHLTEFGTVFGTPAYLPPEQARGQSDRIDKRSDVFGLGSILCEVLTGRPPYDGAYGSEVFRKAANADTREMVVRLESTDAAIDLISLTRWCLSARPKDRPRDAKEVVEVLESYLHSDQRRAEQDLLRFFDLSPDLFCIASYDGFFLRVNDNFPRVLGYAATELVSRPFLDFVHPEDRDRTDRECSSIAFGAQSVRFRNRYRHAAGHYVLFEWNARSWPEERAIYAVARDITMPLDAASAAVSAGA